MKAPLVSVVIPTYQRADLILGAIESCLAQEIAAEVIVVDDGSTDGTGDVVARSGLPVRYLTQTNRREGAARNLGIRHAGAPYVAFLDSDDTLERGKLRRDLDAFAALPGAGLVFSRATYVDERGRVLHVAPVRPPVHRGVAALVRHNYVPLSTATVPLAVLQEVGGFSEEPAMSGSYDWHLWVRIAARYPVVFVPAPGARIRSHSGNMMTDPSRMERAIMTAARAFHDDAAVARELAAHGVVMDAWVELHRALLWTFAGARARGAARLVAAVRADRAVLGDARTWKIVLRVVLGTALWRVIRVLLPRPYHRKG